MRILHVTDFHSSMSYYQWLARVAPRYDLVCLSGDLLDMLAEESSLPKQIAEIKSVLGSFITPLAMSSGNHDMLRSESESNGKLWVRDLRRDQVWADGDRFRLGGHDFYCHGWNEPVPLALPGEIWIIHSPPEGCPVAIGERSVDFGDHEFGELCFSGRGPRLALCGHVHRPRSWWSQSGVSRILNAGCVTGAPWPAHIVLDLEAGTATRRCAGIADETISFLDKTPHELLRDLSEERFEEILRITVLNQRIEGYEMTAAQIEEVRRRLLKIAGKIR